MSDADNEISGESVRLEVHKRVGLAAEVFGKYGDEILTVIRCNEDDRSRANDIFQAFFVSLVRRPIPPDVKNVREYLYKAVTSGVIDFSRQTRNRRNNAQQYAYVPKHYPSMKYPRHSNLTEYCLSGKIGLLRDNLAQAEAGLTPEASHDNLSDCNSINTTSLLLFFLGRLIPGKFRDEILGDVLESCAEQRKLEKDIGEWTIRIRAIRMIFLSIVTSIPGLIMNTFAKARRALSGRPGGQD